MTQSDIPPIDPALADEERPDGASADATGPRPARWRKVLLHPGSLLAIGCVWLALAEGVPLALAKEFWGQKGEFTGMLVELAVALWLILAWKLYRRWIERSADTELPLAGALPEWAAGLAFGMVLFSAMTGMVALLGGIEVLGLRGLGRLWAMLGMAALSGVGEELLFRGVILRQMEKMVGTWGALAFTSAFFGIAHLGNAGATWFAALAIALEAGLLLGAAYLLTRRLWLAIGIHSGWNFTQGWIFSAPVSGGRAPPGLLITQRHGPDWLTGGAFGLEASAVAMVVATFAGVMLLRRVIRAGGIVPAPWVLRRQTKE
ncbi:CPBP family intramembrane glutamic endopeptidase [Novosphingobium rosa]|uniref:CPBP family intramembrane glutamic endopeptidase n=1 Tax=Novosphingobium rosa TaxID=76978 RepID=UPI000835134D|nr:type II CAAX endopeptidase family protein [Novosphingobium rosa]